MVACEIVFFRNCGKWMHTHQVSGINGTACDVCRTAMKAIFATLVLFAIVGGSVVYYARYTAINPVTSFRTVAIKRGDLLSTIGATGTVEPEEVVDVARR